MSKIEAMPDIIRRRARKNLDRLYAEQNSLCWWCRSQTVLVRHIPPECRISDRSGFITWRDGDAVRRGRIATIDHVTPIKDNGGNDGNIVMACADCNKDRTKTVSPVADEIRHQCPTCCGPKSKKQAQCHKCRYEQGVAWLMKCGWTVVMTEERHHRFIDPLTGNEHKLLRMACREQKRRIEVAT